MNKTRLDKLSDARDDLHEASKTLNALIELTKRGVRPAARGMEPTISDVLFHVCQIEKHLLKAGEL